MWVVSLPNKEEGGLGWVATNQWEYSHGCLCACSLAQWPSVKKVGRFMFVCGDMSGVCCCKVTPWQ